MSKHEKLFREELEKIIKNYIGKGLNGQEALKAMAYVIHDLHAKKLISSHDVSKWDPLAVNYPSHGKHEPDREHPLPHSDAHPEGDYEKAESKHHHSKGYPPKYSKNPLPKGSY